ncbi:MAG: type II CAAX endopeptidase family protein [Clostridia bacterium]
MNAINSSNIDNRQAINIKPTKLGSKFDFKDSSLGSVVFVVLQYSILILLTILTDNGVIFTFASTIISQILLELMFAFSVLIVAKINKKNVFESTTLNKKPNIVSTLLCVVIAVICLYGFNGLTSFFITFLEKIGYTPSSGNIVIPNFGIFILYVIAMCIIPAISEEMLFRGLIFNGLKDRGVKKAVLVSALLFMLMHGSPDQTIHQFILGVLLAYVFYYTGSLWYPIIIHFLNNFIVVFITFITYGQTTDVVTDNTWGGIISTGIMSVVFAVISGLLIYFIIIKLLKKRKERDEIKLQVTNAHLMGVENETIVIPDEQTQIHDATGKIITNENAGKKKMDTRSIMFFVASGLILSVEWIYTLIVGFMK